MIYSLPGVLFSLVESCSTNPGKIDEEMVHCSFCSIYFSSASKDSFGAMEVHPVLLFLFVFAWSKNYQLFNIHFCSIRIGIIEIVCCMVSSFSFQLVVCCLQLQAERCPTILQKQIASDSLQGTGNIRRWLQGKAMMSLQRKEYVKEAKKWNWKLERLILQTFLLFLTLICNRFVRIHV